MKKCFVLMLCCLIIAPLAVAQDEAGWQDTVWYEIFVRSFYDSDGDGIGDLQGVIQKLDYLNDGDPNTINDLGITGIWLMPIMESPSYHGYDVTDYFAIEPDYGTTDDFLQLMDEAHKRGIRVIIDLVLNHTSSQHEWFKLSAVSSSEYADWYVWADEDPGYRGPWNQQAWYARGERYYYAPFWSEMPDLNYNNPAVTDEMFNVVDFWLEEMGVDGFRLDAIKYVLEDEINGNLILQDSPANRQWLAIMNEYVHRVKPEAITVGEIWDSTLVVGRYMKDNSIDTAFAFDLATRTVNAARVGSRRDWEKELVNLTETFGAQFAPFLSNHDMNRLMNSLDGSIPANKVAASLLLTIPGTPFLYYGEEIGMTGVKAATTDEPVRTPMQWDSSDNAGFTSGTPWTRIPADFAEFNVAAQTDNPDSLLSHYRALIQLRNAHPALRSTNLQVLNLPLGTVTAYLRWTEDEMLLVVVNTGSDPAVDYELQARGSPLAGITRAEVIFGQGDVAVPQVDENGGFDGYLPLPELAPHSTLILKFS